MVEPDAVWIARQSRARQVTLFACHPPLGGSWCGPAGCSHGAVDGHVWCTGMSEQRPRWEQRLRAPTAHLPRWATGAPQRLVYVGTESGVYQVHAWDRHLGSTRQVSRHPIGVTAGDITPDGERVVFWQDDTGSEAGRWVAQPFAGGDLVPFLEGVGRGWNQGLTQALGVVAVAVSDDAGFAVHVSIDGAPAREIARSTEWLAIGGIELGRSHLAGLAADGTLLALEHSEHGDAIHPAVRVVDPRSGDTVAELTDEGLALSAAAWSPVAGDARLAISHEREEYVRPALWDLPTGEWLDLHLDLDGDVTVADWWPDASALLLVSRLEGRDRLWRYTVASGALERLEHPVGTIEGARVRPDGEVWLEHSSGATPPAVIDLAGARVLDTPGPTAPAGARLVSWHFDNGEGDRVHGFYATPPGVGPFPVMMFVHGGPGWLDRDEWHPEVSAYVDAGFAVGMVNYRGSIGYGRAWRDRLIGDIGGPELVDVNAGLADLVRRGIADPARAVVGGWSWGGYVTVLELGKHPELWLAGVAGVPVGDYELGYEDLSPELQAYDRALIGGTPDEVPELMADRNPIHFADSVRAPVIFLIGENDTRCPLRQAMAFVDKLAARDHPHELVMFDAGHGSYDLAEEVRQAGAILDFLARHVPGVEVPV